MSSKEMVVEVQPAAGGAVPSFEGAMGAVIHDRVRMEMRNVLSSRDPIPFLDETGQSLLTEARDNYARLDLARNWLVQSGSEVQILLWRGDLVNDTLLLMLLAPGFRSMNEGLSINVKDATVARVREA